MKNFFVKLVVWIKSIYSEPDGTGSSSRILSAILAGVCSYLLIIIVRHLITVTDVAILTAWLSSMPMIIGALVLFFTAPYGVNKASGSFSDILSIFKKNV